MPSTENTAPPRIPRITIDMFQQVQTIESYALIPEETYDNVQISSSCQNANVDASGCSFLDCVFSNIHASQLQLNQAHFQHCSMQQCSVEHFHTVRAGIHSTAIADCRIGAMDIMDSSIQSVEFVRCRISYMNARMATFKDVMFRDCIIDDCDASQANLTRVAFSGTTITTLDFNHANLADVDLRKAQLHEIAGVQWLRNTTMTITQIADLAHAFATSLGIRTS